MRVPSAGNDESGALLRMMIQLLLSQLFAGKLKSPVKVAPAASWIVSPQLAALRAACKLPPGPTVTVLPGAGVFAIALWKRTRGNSAGPSNVPVLVTVEFRVSCRVEVRAEASVTLVVKMKVPALLAVPVITPPELRVNPLGSDPEYSDQA